LHPKILLLDNFIFPQFFLSFVVLLTVSPVKMGEGKVVPSRSSSENRNA